MYIKILLPLMSVREKFIIREILLEKDMKSIAQKYLFFQAMVYCHV